MTGHKHGQESMQLEDEDMYDLCICALRETSPAEIRRLATVQRLAAVIAVPAYQRNRYEVERLYGACQTLGELADRQVVQAEKWIADVAFA